MSVVNPKYRPPNIVPLGQVRAGNDYYDEEADALDRDAYYGTISQEAESLPGKDLYLKLSSLLKETHVPQTSYGETKKHLFGWVDRRPDGNLYNLYEGDGPKAELMHPVQSESTLENYNCEHVVPQAWAKHDKPMKTDLHHLFTEDIDRNNVRGNNAIRDLTPNGEAPSQGILDESSQSFEPKGGKGEIARAVLYFVTRYPGDIGNSEGEYQVADLKQLLQWHRDYPVSDYERHRNDAIEEIQGNRNPYIDFPALASRVDFAQGFATR